MANGYPPLGNYSYPPDWLDREVLPDVYPRKDDLYRGGYTPAPFGTPTGPPVQIAPGSDLYAGAITTPGMRPIVYQRAANFQVSVTDSATAIQGGTYQCDAILVDVVSTSSNSTFFGYGSGVTTGSGIEVQPGIPQFFSPSNTREQWEIQRLLEAICALLGYYVGTQAGYGPIPTPGQYMSPRVVMNAHDYYLINTTGITQNVAVMLFNVPEFQ